MGNHPDKPSGFTVWGKLLRARLYMVHTAPTIHVFHGDAVIHGGAVVISEHGGINIIEDSAVPDGAAGLLGAVTCVMDHDMNPVSHIVALTVGDGIAAGYVMVADHPDQEFIGQEDCVTNPIALAEGGMNANIQSPTICLGDVKTGLSRQEIESESALHTAALQVKLHHPHPEDTIPGTEGTNHPRWIVTMNEHFYGDSIAGL